MSNATTQKGTTNKAMVVRLEGELFIPQQHYRDAGAGDDVAGRVWVHLQCTSKGKTFVDRISTNPRTGQLGWWGRDASSVRQFAPATRSLKAFVTAEPAFESSSLDAAKDLTEIPVAVAGRGPLELAIPKPADVVFEPVELEATGYCEDGLVDGVGGDGGLKKQVLGGLPADRLAKLKADLEAILGPPVLRVKAEAKEDGSPGKLQVEEKHFEGRLPPVQTESMASPPPAAEQAAAFQHGFYRARSLNEGSGASGTVGIHMDLHKLRGAQAHGFPLEGIDHEKGEAYAKAARKALVKAFLAAGGKYLPVEPKPTDQGICQGFVELDRIYEHWNRVARAAFQEELARQVGAATAKTLVERCLYFGLGTRSIDETIGDALNAASSHFKVSITSSMSDETARGAATANVRQVIATGIFQFATGHSDLDFYLRPVAGRVAKWKEILPPEVKKWPAAYEWRVDGYASATGDRDVNAKLSSARRTRTWEALKAALKLPADLQPKGEAYPNACETPPDMSDIAAVERLPGDDPSARGDADQKNPASHRVAIVKVQKSVVPTGRGAEAEVQVIQYRQETRTAIPIRRFDVIAYESIKFAKEDYGQIALVLVLPGDKIVKA